jgi:hypothetical protein
MVVTIVTTVTVVTNFINFSVVFIVTVVTIVYLDTTYLRSCGYYSYCCDHCYIGYQD